MNRVLVTGTLAAAAASLIGAVWQVASRHGVSTTLGPLEIAWLRYVLPGVVLLPVLLVSSTRPRLPATQVLLLVATGGLPFGLLVLAGLRLAPAAPLGVFLAGALPLFAALAARAWLHEAIGARRWCGLAVVATGIAAMASGSWAASALGHWRGDLLFVAASLAWAIHTIVLRRTGVTAWQGAAVVNCGSGLLLLLALPFFPPVLLLHAPPHDVLLQAACQGVLAGLLGLAAYVAAVRLLGASRAALSAAAVPVLTLAGAAVWLGEHPDAVTLAAATLVAAGIGLAASARRTA
ncbi:MAG TPA: DMT family transporter [Ramlibacter sp.]|nr:DMT family transporter [Ramlibacter sp.]